MYTVTVLTPEGRRQQVKVTPNTTLLQVLEEVCAKHGFNAQEYDLRHHNKILDVSSMFRFTNLPNNAQLEMTEALRQRQESPVTLGLQFETGDRLTGVFSPSETIWNVIVTLKPEEEKSVNLVVIYMRQEICGIENLKITTLRSLGLTSGRAMLRIFHKSPEELHVQANVSTVLPPRSSCSHKSEEKTPKKHSISPELLKKENISEKGKIPSPQSRKRELLSPTYRDSYNLRGNVFENLLKDEKAKKSLLGGSENNTETKGRKEEHKINLFEPQTNNHSEFKVKTEHVTTKKKPTDEEIYADDTKVILLGERNAIAYNLNSVRPTTFEEEPDDFYDLTVYDAQILLKQAKQLCADLEDAPLMTSAQRELEKDKKVLSLLHQYKKTVLRVKFPDRTVLQGTFSPLETVAAVEKFVAEYLESPKTKFYLYTTPPKVILQPETRLIECGCVPSSVLYFGMPPEISPPAQYLKTEVLGKLSTPSAAALHAYQTRKVNKKSERKEIKDPSEELDVDESKWSKSINNSEAGPSGNQQWENKPRNQESSPHFKVPKWFRSNK